MGVWRGHRRNTSEINGGVETLAACGILVPFWRWKEGDDVGSVHCGTVPQARICRNKAR